MAYGRRTNRPAVGGGPCAAAVLLLAVTLLHAVLALGAVRPSPSAGPDPCAAGGLNRAPATSGDTGAPASVRAPAGSAPASAPAPVVLLRGVPEAEDERSTASASAVFSARDGAGHPARHAGRMVHGASFGAHRSLSTSLGPLVLVAARGRSAGPATGVGAFGAGDDVPAGLLSARSVVLRC
ncbi:hypothetical protein [Streptomyces hygroscopicus]|uniref:hypothetical protein n=1 Tax=Streptomyces hygroscopicus TaxID=1912 RepID=UPI003408B187